MARNRYGWEKTRQRDGSQTEERRKDETSPGVEVPTAPAEGSPEVVEDLSLNETDPAGINIPQDS